MVTQSTIPALFVALARPEFADRLVNLQAAANVGAKDARAHVFDELTRIQEQAKYAQWMAARPIVPSPDVVAANDAARQAERVADQASREAERAAIVLINHRAGQARGWRWLLGQVTRSNARHAAETVKLDRELTTAREQAEAAAAHKKTASRHATLLVESHTKWAKDDRSHWGKRAVVTLCHSKSADRALSVLARWPRLGLMGPKGLLRLGERLLHAESRSDIPMDPSVILKPGENSKPGVA